MFIKFYQAIEDFCRDISACNINNKSRIQGGRVCIQPVIDIAVKSVSGGTGMEGEKNKNYEKYQNKPL